MLTFENNCGKIWCHPLFIAVGVSDVWTTCRTIRAFVLKSFRLLYFCGIKWWILKYLDQCNLCSSRSCNIWWISKSEGKHYKFATTSSSSLVLLGFVPKVFSSFLLDSFSSQISWQETIWVDVTISLLKNSRGKYSSKVIGVMSFCTNRSSTYTITCFLLGFFFFLRMSMNILLTLFLLRKIWVWIRFLLLTRSSSCH